MRGTWRGSFVIVGYEEYIISSDLGLGKKLFHLSRERPRTPKNCYGTTWSEHLNRGTLTFCNQWVMSSFHSAMDTEQLLRKHIKHLNFELRPSATNG